MSDEADDILREIVSRLYNETELGIGWRMGEPGEGDDNRTLIERAKAYLNAPPQSSESNARIVAGPREVGPYPVLANAPKETR